MAQQSLNAAREAFQWLRDEAKRRDKYEEAREHAQKRADDPTDKKKTARVDKKALKAVLPQTVVDKYESKLTASGARNSSGSTSGGGARSSSKGSGPYSSGLKGALGGL